MDALNVRVRYVSPGQLGEEAAREVATILASYSSPGESRKSSFLHAGFLPDRNQAEGQSSPSNFPLPEEVQDSEPQLQQGRKD